MKPKVGRMKTTERSPDRLRLVHFGWYYGAMAAAFGAICLYAGIDLWWSGQFKDALVFTLLGGGASVILGLVATRRVSVVLDRSLGVVHVHNTTALGRRSRSAPLAAFQTADKQTSNTGDLQLHRLTLRFSDRDEWVVTNMYTSGDGADHAVTQINSWAAEYMPAQGMTHENHP